MFGYVGGRVTRRASRIFGASMSKAAPPVLGASYGASEGTANCACPARLKRELPSSRPKPSAARRSGGTLRQRIGGHSLRGGPSTTLRFARDDEIELIPLNSR